MLKEALYLKLLWMELRVIYDSLYDEFKEQYTTIITHNLFTYTCFLITLLFKL